jgi:hypothetical protein
MNKTTEKWESEESAEVVLKVHEAQIQQLYGQTWGGLAGVMVIMVSVCIVLWHIVPQWKLLLWSGALVVLSLARGFLVAAFQRKAPLGAPIYWWARMHVAGVVASGVMWALPPLFLWPENSPVHQVIWPICIVALAASAVAKYCTWPPAYISYLVLTAVPLSLRLLAEGGLVFTILGLLGFVFAAILFQTGKMMHTASLRALLLGVHNETLSSVLSTEKEKEEQLNAQLQREITKRIRSQEELHHRNQELEQLNTQLTATKNNLESANKELEQALLDIKQLSGMLPICASCKKIRNDNGYWQQIEIYIRDHADVEFSHGICPDCAAKLYPDLIYRT